MKRFFKSLASVFLAVFMVASLMIIPSSAAPSLSKTSITLTKGYQTTLSVSGSSKTVTWSTGDKSIATVSSQGKVVGKGIGTTYIYAKVSNTTLKCKVKVVAAKITASSSSVSLDEPGDSKTVTMTVKGSHSGLSVGSTNKKVATASFVRPISWNGDKIKINITAKGAGSARIKVYLKNYSSSCYKYIDVDVDDDGDISVGGNTNDTNTSSSSITILPYTNNVEVATGGTYTLQVYSTNQNNLAYSLTSSNIASVTAGNASGYYRNYTIKGVNPGTTSLRLYDKNNSKNYYDVKITVGGSAYYEFYTTTPTKLISTDQVMTIKVDSRTTYYMLVPANYDPAYTNRLIAQKFSSYSYYSVYDIQPARMASGDTYYDFYHQNSKYNYGARYVLLPKDYDKVKLNTAVASYNGFYEYYTVYNESPVKHDSWDQIETWQVREALTGRTINRYMLVPYNSDLDRITEIKNEDMKINNAYNYYVPLTEWPNVLASSNDKVILYRKGNTTKYMVVPADDSGIIKANDAIYKDTGIYEYNVRYSTSPTASDGEAVAVGQSGSNYIYILYKTSVYDSTNAAVNASVTNYADGIKDN